MLGHHIIIGYNEFISQENDRERKIQRPSVILMSRAIIKEEFEEVETEMCYATVKSRA